MDCVSVLIDIDLILKGGFKWFKMIWLFLRKCCSLFAYLFALKFFSYKIDDLNNQPNQRCK